MGSPRIAAVPVPTTATNGGPEQGQGASLGSLLRRLSQQLHLGSSGSAAAVPAEPAPAQPLASAASIELADGDELELLLVGMHSAASNCSLGTPATAGAGPFPHLSPAHLLAPAQPGFTSQPSTKGTATPDAAPTPADAAGDDGDSPPQAASSDPAASAERAAPLMDVMQWQLLSELLEEEQHAGWQHERQLGAQQGMSDDAALASVSQASPTSPASSSCYDPLVAAGRYLGSVGQQAARTSSSSPPPASSPAGSASPTGSCWQLLQDEGPARCSATHPLFGLQPERNDTAEQGQQGRQRRRRLLAGLAALVPSQWHANSPGHGGKSWTVRDSHIQVDLVAAASPCPSPQRAAAWEQQALRASWAAPPGAVYASLCEQLQQMDLRRAR